DELVMAALLMRPGARFDPAGFHAFCERQVESGGVGPQRVSPFLRIRPHLQFPRTPKVAVWGPKSAPLHPPAPPATESPCGGRGGCPALGGGGFGAPAARVRRRGARAAARRLTALLDARPARGVRIRNPGYESGTRGAPRDPDPAAGSRARAGAWPRCLPVVI